MKFHASLLVILSAMLISGASHAQDAPKKTQQPKVKITNRVPNNYGKIGLSDEQRKKIYTIQSSYRTKMQSLLRELNDLRTQQNLEIQSTLTEQQRKELQTIIEAAQKKREANRAKRNPKPQAK
ncbi:MAG: hypothetical protein JKY95_18545 [Planctomycetaceae bacterium]|nr:hypothetical protein [Planctomycetaceae bacterium]